MPSTPPDSSTPPAKRSWLRRLLNRLEVDQAVFYSIAASGWQFLAGPITTLLIVLYFTPEAQGYYVTFWSIIGLQMLFELSLPGVILTVASHEWEKLSQTSDGTITGDERALSRLQSLARKSVVIYGAAAILFLTIVGVGGFMFFSLNSETGSPDWQGPWTALVVLASLAFWLSPLLSLLEGCNQVKQVYRFQFSRAVVGNLVVWCAIPLGLGLWIPALLTLVRLIMEASFLGITQRRHFAQLLARPRGDGIHWNHEVWPFQWRTALKAVGYYCSRYLLTPVVFHFQGDVAAGRIGLTWNILSSLQLACYSWVRTRSPLFGMLIARRDFAELDRVFFRVTKIAGLFACATTGAFWLCVVALERFAPGLTALGAPDLAARLLPSWPTALLCIGVVCSLLAESCWVYVHAHQRAPFLLNSLLIIALQAILLVWWGASYGALGIAASMIVINALLSLPLSLRALHDCRTRWH